MSNAIMKQLIFERKYFKWYKQLQYYHETNNIEAKMC